MLTLILVIALVLGAVLLYFKNGRGEILDTRTAFIALRFILILFILFRPRFIDESGVAFKFKNSGPSVGKISLSNFELLFFGNQYFLRSEGNLENFALMLNQPKLAVSTFVKENFKDSFGELMNKNRVNYFKSLLQSKQHESFTIEALSEMAGFKNRQSMYNSFKKYEGNSPSDYLNNL